MYQYSRANWPSVAPWRARTPGFAIGLHVAGIRRVGEQRDVSKNIVEYIRLLKIVELLEVSYETPGDELTIGQMMEEYFLRNDAGNGDDGPAGEGFQPLVEGVEPWECRVARDRGPVPLF